MRLRSSTLDIKFDVGQLSLIGPLDTLPVPFEDSDQ